MCGWTKGRKTGTTGCPSISLQLSKFQRWRHATWFEPHEILRRVEHSNRSQPVVASKLILNHSFTWEKWLLTTLIHYFARKKHAKKFMTWPLCPFSVQCHGAQTRAPSPRSAAGGQSESQSQSAAKDCRGTEWEAPRVNLQQLGEKSITGHWLVVSEVMGVALNHPLKNRSFHHWFGTFFIHILGISSSQLFFPYFPDWNPQPDHFCPSKVCIPTSALLWSCDRGWDWCCFGILNINLSKEVGKQSSELRKNRLVRLHSMRGGVCELTLHNNEKCETTLNERWRVSWHHITMRSVRLHSMNGGVWVDIT